MDRLNGPRPVVRAIGLLALGAWLAACNLTAHLPSFRNPTPTQAANQPSPTPTAAPLSLPSPTPAAPLTATPSPLPSLTETLGATFSSTERSERRGSVTLVTTTNITRYHINAPTAAGIDEQMRTLGPTDPLGGYHWYALTEPLFDWRYPCPCESTGCTTGPVTIYLTLRYTLPLWLAPDSADATLQAQWTAFEAALTLHEHGHGDRATECAWALGEAFVKLPPVPACTDVDQAVSAASHDVFAICREAQRQYETETDHGRSQGVIWPP